jgi:hypothetical protein
VVTAIPDRRTVALIRLRAAGTGVSARRSAAVSVICCSLSGEKPAAGPSSSLVMALSRW